MSLAPDRSPRPRPSPPGGLLRLLLAFVLFGGLGLLVLVGPALFGLKGAGALSRFMGAGVQGPLAPALAVLGFTGLAFIGAPQFVLIGVAVLAFGPGPGFVYSWIGTLTSSLVGFLLGRRFGARLLADHGGARVRRFLELVGRNGFLASLLVRLAPSAPFIVVNMAAGMTPMRLVSFLAGTALGIIPKIAVTAFAGRALAGGSPWRWGLLGLAVLAWAVLGLGARSLFKSKENQAAPGPGLLQGRAGAEFAAAGPRGPKKPGMTQL